MQTITVGRNQQNSLVVNDSTVSGNHCVLTEAGNGMIEIKDLYSTNGTYVNERRISSAHLKPGDNVRIGNYHLNWEGLFSQTQLPTREINENKIMPEHIHDRAPAINVNISGNGKGSKNVRNVETASKSFLNFAKAAFYLALAILLFYIIYKIFS